MKFKWLANKEVSNANWLIAGRIAQMIISLLVGILTARYLGPNNYGLINYALAYVTFFSAFCTLGINSIIVKELLDTPSEEGEVIGTTIFLRVISSVLSAIMIVGIVAIVDRNEPITICVVALCGLSLPFQAWDTINYWFQAQYKSKITAISTLLAYILISLYKIILLIFQKDIIWFALANAIDYFAMAVFLWIAYKRHKGPRLRISKGKAKKLLHEGYHYILASLMIAVYTQTDKIMLKQMLGATDVGFYSVANTICGMWVFVLTAIIDSMYPTILRLFKKEKSEFERKNKQLYAIVFYCSIFVSLVFLFFGDIAVALLYGEEYKGAVNPLKMLTWYNAFAYLGVALKHPFFFLPDIKMVFAHRE